MPDNEAINTIRRLQTNLPINIVGIAKYLGLEVWEDANLPDKISGKLFRDVKNGGIGGYSIAVRAQDPLVRKRFTVAHELAHYILHRTLFNDVLIDDALYRSELSSRVEAQANRLAAELLMPLHLISPFSHLPTKDLASMAQVSEEAMNIRLQRPQRIAV
jgi:hypothetical protein